MFSVKLERNKSAFIEKYANYLEKGIEVENATNDSREKHPYTEIGAFADGLLRFL